MAPSQIKAPQFQYLTKYINESVNQRDNNLKTKRITGPGKERIKDLAIYPIKFLATQPIKGLAS